MSIRTILVMVLAGTCGVSAAVGINQLRKPTQVVAEPETGPIVVAAADIPRGRMVTERDVRVRQWPKEMILKGALTRAEDAVERAAMIPLVAGEPILDVKLASKDAGRGMAALVPKGMRAYTIQASKVASNVAGFVLPGNRVDVLLNLRGKPDDETGGGSTTTLLQSVEILAVDDRVTPPAENKVDPKDVGSVTLLVTADQAALLDLGQNMGQLSLSLRNPEDKQEAITRPALLADIRYRQEKPLEEPEPGDPPPIVRKKAPEVFSILTLRGTRPGEVLVTSQQ